VHSGSDRPNRPECQFIDSRELAERWAVPQTWIRERVRARCEDPLPHVRFGKYVRFRWGSPELEGWAERRSPIARSREDFAISIQRQQ
jgi:hypothetical protein